MKVSDGGYAASQYKHADLRDIVKDMAVAIPYLLKRHNADTIVVTGKSGLSVAYAALASIDFPLVTIRKRGETTHGNHIEGTNNHIVQRYIVLDDFVSSGATVRTIVSDIADYCNSNNKVIPELVAVIEWSNQFTPRAPSFYQHGLEHLPRYKTGGCHSEHTMWEVW